MKNARINMGMALLLTCALAACSSPQPTAESPTATASHMPNEAALLSPQGLPVAHSRSDSLSGLSANTTNALTKDGWVEHTFSTGEKLLFRNYEGSAVYGDVAYAKTKDMPEYVRTVENFIAGKGVTAQSFGLNPQGCSARFFFCTVYTTAYMWAGHRVDYYFGDGFTPTQKQKIQQQIDVWNATNIHIKWYPSPGQANSKVGFFPVSNVDYCGQAYIGYQGRVVVPNLNYININVGIGCEDSSTGTVNHEMGHVVGLPHEQSRCDRDSFVRLGSGYEGASDRKCGDDVKYYDKFDYDSIMLYQSPFIYPAFSTPATGTYRGVYPTSGLIGRKTVLTQGDITSINGIYDSPYNPRP